jgi:hypothetical protein
MFGLDPKTAIRYAENARQLLITTAEEQDPAGRPEARPPSVDTRPRDGRRPETGEDGLPTTMLVDRLGQRLSEFARLRDTWPVTSEPASQPTKGAEIWIICGNSCAGKTTTARLLAQRLPLAAHVDGDEMQRLIVSGCRWAMPSDSDPGTGRLTGEAGVQYALRIRNACLVAAAFADAGIAAIVTDSIINEGFESLTQVLGGRAVNFVVLRPPVAMLRQRGIDRMPEEAAYLADRYGDSDHPEAATFAAQVQAAADGRPVNEFEEVIERGLDRLPHVGLWVDPSGLDPQSVVDLLLDRRAEAVWMVDVGSNRGQ